MRVETPEMSFEEMSFEEIVAKGEGNRTGQDYTCHWAGHHGRFLHRFSCLKGDCCRR